jgi:hypothetical protein
MPISGRNKKFMRAQNSELPACKSDLPRSGRSKVNFSASTTKTIFGPPEKLGILHLIVSKQHHSRLLSVNIGTEKKQHLREDACHQLRQLTPDEGCSCATAICGF